MNKQGEYGIPYCDYTWNPVTGCLHGCSYCFAERIAKRFAGSKAFPNGFAPMFHERRLEEPERIKKPSRIFVSDMGDLFGEWVSDNWILKILDTIKECPQHIFLLLTKNPKRYNEFEIPDNAWIGTSVENQAAADERIPLLLQAQASVRLVSIEPMLGPISLRWLSVWGGKGLNPNSLSTKDLDGLRCLDWVIVGGESGPGARPVHPTWVRSLRDQCKAANVPFFFKQWGEWGWFQGGHGSIKLPATFVDGEPFKAWMVRVGKKKAGRILDGRTWDEMPCEPK
ncbi:phage Gp37/Gp68 family protein [Desulfosporosinus sp. OT]|uniref:phage Gp37/Gp68 family protein n=1 Tax=Desulfosporosinus sp. OT TaxID=913865 RepID=UPI000223A4EC|nr:phage Gp37/Gp68 family protein [Desulfosporosinus sp. OT]EGW36493.1 hypothetical protein DOT_5657 [Desulfosporosinus sp. OT]